MTDFNVIVSDGFLEEEFYPIVLSVFSLSLCQIEVGRFVKHFVRSVKFCEVAKSANNPCCKDVTEDWQVCKVDWQDLKWRKVANALT